MTGAELDRTTKNPRTPAIASAYRVVVETGRDAGASAVVAHGGIDRLLLGTSPTCQLRLTDPLVSRRHVVLEPTAQGLSVVDIGSTNGTSIHGVRVREAIVDAGARITIGDTTLRIEPATEPAASIPEAEAFGRMIGASRATRRLFALGHQLASSSVPVVIEGEAGTGKALFAETLHEASPRAGGPFLVFDASSVPSTRAAPILFGTTKVSSGANKDDTVGLWERAHGGTLLISEPALLPSDVQRRLVRLVERRESAAADVRLVVASRTDLDAAVEDGRVREDFFHVFVGARVAIAPLRARREDIEGLARHLWKELGGAGELASALLERLQAHSWPGNVRELESVVARHAALGEFGELPRAATDDVDGGFIEQLLDRELPIIQARELLVQHFERRYVGRVLKRHEHIGDAAAASGLAPRYFRTLKAKYGHGSK
jgi:DNA-binding NtrC family response regulator